MLLYSMHEDKYYGSNTYVLLWIVYCVVTDPAPSERRNKISMMMARYRNRPCCYRDDGGEWHVFTLIQGRTRWISNGHVN